MKYPALATCFALTLALTARPTLAQQADSSYDVVVYGGTSAGVAAAIQAKRMGKTVIVVSPDKHLGGLTSRRARLDRLGQQGRHRRRRPRVLPAREEALRHAGGVGPPEAGAVRAVPQGRGRDVGLRAARRGADVRRVGEGARHPGRPRRVARPGEGREDARAAKIVSITTLDGKTYAGRMFIDATYEGDLMAAAGVSFTVGREANSQYGETLNGVQTARAVSHQFTNKVDPYVVPGDPTSGLLPRIHDGDPGKDGEGDKRIQAYNFRTCLTNVPANRVPVPQARRLRPQAVRAAPARPASPARGTSSASSTPPPTARPTPTTTARSAPTTSA